MHLRLAFTTFALTIVINSVAQKDTAAINTFIDKWHLAATTADLKSFFDAMAKDAIYIGTDSSERWTKEEFYRFAKPYFDRGKAWDFKPFDRDIHVSNDGQFAWFSELLVTWMGACRGSGILRKTADRWEIKQYHLSVTVPNDAINDFISLVNNFNKNQKR